MIQVFKVGEFIYSSYFFIDMELCDLSLQGYLYPDTLEYAGLGLPPLFKHLPSSAVADYIWNIMRQIASGLKFVHTKCIAHRDVKPSNGDPDFSFADRKFYIQEPVLCGN